MRADTQTVTIDVPPERVGAFVADPRNLPRWAVGFARDVRHEDGRWIVTSAQGDVALRVDTDPRRGTVDFVMAPAPGVEVTAYSRVVANGDGAEYVFTQIQTPGTPDELFEGQVDALRHELQVLKRLLEDERRPR